MVVKRLNLFLNSISSKNGRNIVVCANEQPLVHLEGYQSYNQSVNA